MAPSDMLNLTLSEAAARVERRTLSPVELTEAALQRIAAVDKVLSAYITVCGEQAREVAQPATTSARSTVSPSPSRTTSTRAVSARRQARRSWPTSFPQRTPP